MTRIESSPGGTSILFLGMRPSPVASAPSRWTRRGGLTRLKPMRPLLLLVLLAFAFAPARAEFRAAVVKVDITPQTPQWLMGYGARKSTGVRDRISHKIAALDDGTSQVFIVASDLCLFSPTVYDEVAAELKKEM